jgi:malate/lactate dehydrogenase
MMVTRISPAHTLPPLTRRTTRLTRSNYTDHNVRVLVVGIPSNTNEIIAMYSALNLTPANCCAMMRLNQNRGVCILSKQLKLHTSRLRRATMWGNRSAS